MRLSRLFPLSRLSGLSGLVRRTSLSLFLPCALATVVLLLQARAAALPVDPRPANGPLPLSNPQPPNTPRPTSSAPDQHAFPLTTRIHGGPDRYVAGGAARTWFIDVKNTTSQPTRDIHPVLVLVDTRRTLTAAQAKLEFFDGDRPHPVTFERTDERELVGAFDDGFPGFTLAPGQTISVKVRLALAPGTPQDDVVATAAIVQRHGNDGDWVGQSNDYRFRIEAGARTSAETGTERSPAPRHSPAGQELANTGPQSPHGLGSMTGMTGGLLLAAGGILAAGLSLLLYRWRRRARPQSAVPGGKETEGP